MDIATKKILMGYAEEVAEMRRKVLAKFPEAASPGPSALPSPESQWRIQ